LHKLVIAVFSLVSYCFDESTLFFYIWPQKLYHSHWSCFYVLNCPVVLGERVTNLVVPSFVQFLEQTLFLFFFVFMKFTFVILGTMRLGKNINLELKKIISAFWRAQGVFLYSQMIHRDKLKDQLGSYVIFYYFDKNILHIICSIK